MNNSAIITRVATDAETEVISANEVARMLGLNRKTVYEAAGRGDLPSRRLGRRLLFSRSAVLEWLQCKASSERVR